MVINSRNINTCSNENDYDEKYCKCVFCFKAKRCIFFDNPFDFFVISNCCLKALSRVHSFIIKTTKEDVHSFCHKIGILCGFLQIVNIDYLCVLVCSKHLRIFCCCQKLCILFSKFEVICQCSRVHYDKMRNLMTHKCK